VILAGISSTDVSELLLKNSYHVAPLDYDAEALFAASLAFAARITAADPVS
jgi:carboxylesterase